MTEGNKTKIEAADTQVGTPSAPRIMKPSKKRILLITVALVIIGLIFAQVFYLAHKTFRVGTHSFTSQDLDKTVSANEKAAKAAGQKNIDATKLKKEAQDQAILLAGLKTEADKRGITYSQTDLDGFIAQKYKQYGTEAQYADFMQRSYGWSKEDVYRKNAIDYLEGKLQSSLISTRTYSMTFIRWDTLKTQYPNDYQKHIDDKIALMKAKYLPDYVNKDTPAQLAAAAELNDNQTRDQQYDVYEQTNGAPITYTQMTFGINNPSSGFQTYPEGESLNSKMLALKNVGDYTGPFKANTGQVIIVRLDDSKGGNFADWTAFTNYYRKQSGITFTPAILHQTVGFLRSNWHMLTDALSQNTVYALPSANCLVSHKLDYKIQYRDNNTNTLLSGANIGVTATARRSTDNCDKSGYTSSGWAVSTNSGCSGTCYIVTKSFADNNAGTLDVILDCNGPAYNIQNDTVTNNQIDGVKITGYTYNHTIDYKGNSTTSANYFPYFSGANSVVNFDSTLYYSKNPDWTLSTTGPTVSNASPTPGTTITFTHWVHNNAGSSTATNIAWGYKTYHEPNAGTGWSAVNSIGTISSIAAGTNSAKFTHSFTIPAGMAPGTQVCELTHFGQADGPGTGPREGGNGCATVQGPSGGTNYVNCSAGTSSISGTFGWTGVSSSSQAKLRRDGTTDTTSTLIATGGAGVASGGPVGFSDSPGVGTHTYYLTGNGTVLASASCTIVPPNPPSVSVNPPACPNSALTGSAQDPDDPGSELIVQLSVDGGGVVQSQTTSSHNFSFDISSYFNGSDHTFTVTALGVDSSGGQDGTNGSQSVGMIGCGQYTITPTVTGSLDDPQAPTTYDGVITYTTTYGSGWSGPSGGVPSGASYWISQISGAGSSCTSGNILGPNTYPYDHFLNNSYQVEASVTCRSASDSYCLYARIQNHTGYVDRNGNILTATGPFDATPACSSVQNQPYFKAYGGSLSAGGEFKVLTTNCKTGTPDDGVLGGWFNNSDPAYGFGSSTQLSTRSFLDIIGLASDNNSDRLAFSNTTGNFTRSSYSPTLGGRDGYSGHCILTPNQKRTATNTAIAAAATGDAGSNNYDIPANASGNYTYNGNLELGNGGDVTLTNGSNAALYITGDVYIKHNIIYSSTGWSANTNNGTTNVPSLIVVVTGNIYIDPGVQRLDGIYLAQNISVAGSKGRIYTCGQVSGANSFDPLAGASMYGCNNQLTVYGEFVADKVNLMRTYGSLRDEAEVGGAQTGLKWTSAGGTPTGADGIGGMRCTWVNEPSEQGYPGGPNSGPPNHTWDDNYICVPSSSPVHLVWTYSGGTFGGYSCTNGWGSVVNPLGVSGSYTWGDDFLCSDVNIGLTFRKGNDPTKVCIPITESADHDGNGSGDAWTQTYLCENKAPSSPPNPATLTCSNPGVKTSGRQTCGGEIFEYDPEIFLGSPSADSGSSGAVYYDTISSLPPVL